jgi:hypothetical protein
MAEKVVLMSGCLTCAHFERNGAGYKCGSGGRVPAADFWCLKYDAAPPRDKMFRRERAVKK